MQVYRVPVFVFIENHVQFLNCHYFLLLILTCFNVIEGQLNLILLNIFLGTQRVISFLRQMLEYDGFYRPSDQAWVKFERIQFVGACNPPTDPGRKPLSHR